MYLLIRDCFDSKVSYFHIQIKKKKYLIKSILPRYFVHLMNLSYQVPLFYPVISFYELYLAAWHGTSSFFGCCLLFFSTENLEDRNKSGESETD